MWSDKRVIQDCITRLFNQSPSSIYVDQMINMYLSGLCLLQGVSLSNPENLLIRLIYIKTLITHDDVLDDEVHYDYQ